MKFERCFYSRQQVIEKKSKNVEPKEFFAL